MKVGFTGTGDGMTLPQLSAVDKQLGAIAERFENEEFHHGDCVGSDAEAHDLALYHGFDIIVHPPNNDKARAFKEGYHVHPVKSYLDRNNDIVAAIDLLLATPGTTHEVQRSGTWYTIRRAKAVGVKTVIIYPNGDYAIW